MWRLFCYSLYIVSPSVRAKRRLRFVTGAFLCILFFFFFFFFFFQLLIQNNCRQNWFLGLILKVYYSLQKRYAVTDFVRQSMLIVINSITFYFSFGFWLPLTVVWSPTFGFRLLLLQLTLQPILVVTMKIDVAIYKETLALGPRVYLASCKSALNSPVVYSTDRSKAVVPVLVLLFVAFWFILRGHLLYVFPCVILFLRFLVL